MATRGTAHVAMAHVRKGGHVGFLERGVGIWGAGWTDRALGEFLEATLARRSPAAAAAAAAAGPAGPSTPLVSFALSALDSLDSRQVRSSRGCGIHVAVYTVGLLVGRGSQRTAQLDGSWVSG